MIGSKPSPAASTPSRIPHYTGGTPPRHGLSPADDLVVDTAGSGTPMSLSSTTGSTAATQGGAAGGGAGAGAGATAAAVATVATPASAISAPSPRIADIIRTSKLSKNSIALLQHYSGLCPQNISDDATLKDLGVCTCTREKLSQYLSPPRVTHPHCVLRHYSTTAEEHVVLLWTMFHHYASAGDPTHATTIGYATAATTPCFTLCVAAHMHCNPVGRTAPQPEQVPKVCS